jgi:pyridoxal phosphate enzyme (YggS family)
MVAVDAVRQRIVAACERVGRDPDEVTLIAVTKYLALEVVHELVAAGVTDLGENQAQQLRDRAPLFTGVRWHAIGPLQANKAKYVAAHADAFHALDRVEIAEALSARRQALGRAPLPCYVQVNVAGEASKAGVTPAELGPLLAGLAAAALPGIEVVGLMAMPPLVVDPDDSRPWFRQLAALAAEHGCGRLSMGTSADFEVAVEEGATAVRLGAVLTDR